MSEQVVREMIAALEALPIPYMLVGSFSSNFFGIPRSTQDADFVVSLGDVSIRTVLERLGPDYRLDPQMTFKGVTGTYRYIIEHTKSPFKVEVFLLGDDPHDQARFTRRRRVTTPQGEAFLPTAEDVIVTKLHWALLGKRGKDIDDVRNVIAVQADRLDWDYITHWCDQHGTRELLEELRREQPPL